MKPGKQNLITDVAHISVGHAQDDKLKSGVTAVLFDADVTASVHVMGGAPGTRETDLLSPENTVESVDALVLSGGSAFGLDSATGVQTYLRENDRGFPVGEHRIPIVPAAILFDLINGGDKSWEGHPPYRELGYQAAKNADHNFELGSYGAGTGATTGGPGGGLKGGIGSASTVLPSGITVGALVAVNAMGTPLMGDTGRFWAHPFELNNEFGGKTDDDISDGNADRLDIKFRDTNQPGTNTTIGIIATDAKLDKSQAKRLAVAAHDGFARAIWPAHTTLDGDLIFSAATHASGRKPDPDEWIDLSAAAASTMSRAIARGVYCATPAENDLFPTWVQSYANN